VNRLSLWLSRQRSRNEGFTLVEMLVALFIVAVVMAISIPNLQRAGTHAARVASEGDQRMIRAALSEYYLDNHAYPQEASTTAILQDLVSGGYIDAIPSCPAGGSFVVTISSDGTTATVSSTAFGQLGS
jgi:prepilin-type N-terminal cleavage/methylation domain-containing protein